MELKTAIDGLGANKTGKAIQRVGKCAGKFIQVHAEANSTALGPARLC